MKFFKSILSIFIFLSLLNAQQVSTLKLKYETQKLPFGLELKKSIYSPNITLVLSGGGSRGLCQIGIIKAFEENNVSFNSIVGTSMGSIIGGLFSSGYSTEDLEKVGLSPQWKNFTRSKDMNRKDLFVDQKIAEDKAFLTLRLDGLKPMLPSSLNTGRGIAAFLNDLSFEAPIFAEKQFDRLLYDFKAVATDLIKGEPVILEQGSVVKAMRSSSSVSLLMPPVRMDSLLLADGGLVSNVPVEIARSYNPDFIIAVNTTSPLKSEYELRLPWNVADQIVSIPILVNNKHNLKQADFLINPNIGEQNGINFNGSDSLILKGYESAVSNILELKNKIKAKSLSLISADDNEIINLQFPTSLNSTEYLLKDNLKNYGKVTSKILLYEVSEIFETGNFDDIQINIENQKETNHISLDVKFNPMVYNIKLSGLSDKFYKTGLEILNELIDKPYNKKILVQKLVYFLKMYRASNHSLSKINKIYFDDKRNTLEIEVSEGRIDEIIIEGNNKTDRTIITREIPLKVGEIFNSKKLSQALVNLQSSNLFDEVELIIKEADGKNQLIAKVEEKITGVARFGVRIDNEYSTQIAVDLRDENVLGTGTELGATIRSGLKNHSLILEHKSNRIFDTYLTYKIQGYYKSNEIKVYSTDSTITGNNIDRVEVAKYSRSFTGATFGLGTQVERFGNILMKFSYEKNKINNKNNFLDKETEFNLFILNLSMHIDSQDKYPFPTSGFKILSEYESALPIFSSDVSYTKFLFNYLGYFPVGKEQTLFTRFNIGFGDPTMPLSKHFSFGGQQSFFGFRENEFMGRQIFITSFGYRYKLPFKLIVDTYIKFRYDLGSVWAEKEALRFKDMKHGVGFSVAMETPIGPAEFSYGHSFTFKNGLFKKGIIAGDSYYYFTIGYYY